MNTHPNNFQKHGHTSSELEILKKYKDENIHPEYFGLSKLPYNYFVTIKESTNNHLFCGAGRNSESFRKMACGLFVDFFRRKLKLRSNELIWVACEEYGTSECGHVHILVSIFKKKPRDFLGSNNWSEFKLPAYGSLRFDIVVQSVGQSTSEQKNVVSYFCKKEYGYPEKMFWFSDGFLKMFQKHAMLLRLNKNYYDNKIHAWQSRDMEFLIGSHKDIDSDKCVDVEEMARLTLTA